MRRQTRTSVLLGAAVVAAVLAGLAVPALLTSGRQPPQAPTPLTERVAPTDRAPLPDVTLAGFGGRPAVALAGYRGRPLVVNLWATWCAPCVEEMPAFQQLADAAGDRVAFLGVDVQDTPQRAERFVAMLGITYDLAIDPKQDFARAIGAFGMPTTLLVDSGGTIVYRHTGPLAASDLRRLLAEHLSLQVSSGQADPAG